MMAENIKNPLITKEIALGRLKVGFGVAILVAVIFSIGLIVLSAISWSKESNLYDSKVVKQNKVALCSAIKGASDGSDLSPNISAMYGEQTEEWAGWSYAKHFRDCTINSYSYSNPFASCYFSRLSLFEYFGCVEAPLTFWKYLEGVLGKYWVPLSLGIIFIGLVPLLAYFIGRLFRSGVLIESHPGWRRVQITIAAAILSVGVIRAFMRMGGWQDTFIDDLLLSVLFAIVGWIGFVFIRWIMRWLKEGFQVVEGQANANVSKSSLTNPVQRSQPEVIAEVGNASFWARLWARVIDIFIVSLVAGLIDLAGLLLLLVIPSDMGMLLTISEVIAGLIWTCLFLYWYDSYMLYKFQTTIGKLAVGIRVLNKNYQPMTLRESRSRAYLVMSKALSFMVFYPYIQIYNAWQAKKALDSGFPVSWDGSGTVVQQKKISMIRLVAVACLAVSLLLTQLVLQKVQKEITKQEIRSSVLR